MSDQDITITQVIHKVIIRKNKTKNVNMRTVVLHLWSAENATPADRLDVGRTRSFISDSRLNARLKGDAYEALKCYLEHEGSEQQLFGLQSYREMTLEN